MVRRGAFFDELLSENGIFLVVENQLLHTYSTLGFLLKMSFLPQFLNP
jgi:hypothetical protein